MWSQLWEYDNYSFAKKKCYVNFVLHLTVVSFLFAENTVRSWDAEHTRFNQSVYESKYYLQNFKMIIIHDCTRVFPCIYIPIQMTYIMFDSELYCTCYRNDSELYCTCYRNGSELYCTCYRNGSELYCTCYRNDSELYCTCYRNDLEMYWMCYKRVHCNTNIKFNEVHSK